EGALYAKKRAGWSAGRRGVRRGAMRDPVRGDNAHATGLIVLAGLDDLLTGVNDERAVARHRLPDRQAAEDQDLPSGTRGQWLRVRGRDRQRLTGTEHRQLAFVHRTSFEPDVAAAGQDVHQRV